MGKYIEVQIMNLMEEHKEELYNAFATEKEQKQANSEPKTKNKRSTDDTENTRGVACFNYPEGKDNRRPPYGLGQGYDRKPAS